MTNHLQHILKLIDSNKSIHKIRGYCEQELSRGGGILKHVEEKIVEVKRDLAGWIEHDEEIAAQVQQMLSIEIKNTVEKLVKDGEFEFDKIKYRIVKDEKQVNIK